MLPEQEEVTARVPSVDEIRESRRWTLYLEVGVVAAAVFAALATVYRMVVR